MHIATLCLDRDPKHICDKPFPFDSKILGCFDKEPGKSPEECVSNQYTDRIQHEIIDIDRAKSAPAYQTNDKLGKFKTTTGR
jgi:hypothetical protein